MIDPKTSPMKLAEEIERERARQAIPHNEDGTDIYYLMPRDVRVIAAALRLAESCQQFVDEEGNVWQDFDSEAFEAYLKELES